MRGIELNRSSGIPLSRQIYNTFRDQILDGRMKPGEALPSTRELASQLAVSRSTVCEAYDMLLAEAFAESRQGAPTRVAAGIQLRYGNHTGQALTQQVKTNPRTGSVSVPETQKETCKSPGSSSSGSTSPASPMHKNATESGFQFPFRTGLPDLSKFPMHSWLQLTYRASETLKPEEWGYTAPEGLPELRNEISAWLFRSRGMDINPEDIFITAGATHGLHLLSELLFTRPCGIIVEDPCHTGMLRTLEKTGFEVIPAPVDEQGLITENLKGFRQKVVYVTPSHQFPLGGILPAGRRAELIRYAQQNGAFIIEDDYDSEFRYSGPPVAPLHSMDPERVIYVGTFSKILFPALRIGYVILPRELQGRWRYLRIHTDVQNPPFEQAALSQFMASRKFDHHVSQMRKVYSQRRQILLQSLESEFGKHQRCWGDAAGLHMAVQFHGAAFDRGFAAKCKENGIYLQTVDYHSIHKGVHIDKLLLGYGHLDSERIRTGIARLSELIHPLPGH